MSWKIYTDNPQLFFSYMNNNPPQHWRTFTSADLSDNVHWIFLPYFFYKLTSLTVNRKAWNYSYRTRKPILLFLITYIFYFPSFMKLVETEPKTEVYFFNHCLDNWTIYWIEFYWISLQNTPGIHLLHQNIICEGLKFICHS